MANVNRATGFRPVGTISGAPWNAYLRRFRVSGSGSDIYPGDMVQMTSTGVVAVADNSTVELVGVMAGRGDLSMPPEVGGITDTFLSRTSPDLERQYYDASVDGDREIFVVVGPDVVYQAQQDGNPGLTLANVGENAAILATAGAGTISQQQIAASTVAPASNQLRIVDIVDSADNAVGQYSKWTVRINTNHYTKLAGV